MNVNVKTVQLFWGSEDWDSVGSIENMASASIWSGSQVILYQARQTVDEQGHRSVMNAIGRSVELGRHVEGSKPGRVLVALWTE